MHKEMLLAILLTLFSLQAFAGSWHLAYEHSSTGEPVSGSYDDLIKDFKNGASIRIFINDYQMMVNPTYCKINQTNQYFLCQASFHGADDKTLIRDTTEIDIFTTNGERIYQVYSMSGAFKYDASNNLSMKWFTQH